MELGIREILLISSPQFLSSYQKLLGDGSQWGINLSYANQRRPQGIPQAFVIGARFIKGHKSCLALGDNVVVSRRALGSPFTTHGFERGAVLHAQTVADASDFGVVAFDESGQAAEIVEKPVNHPSRWAIIGLYFYDEEVLDIARALKPSSRGELEISDVNNHYLKLDQLRVRRVPRSHAWFDAGSPDRLMAASCLVRKIQRQRQIQLASPVATAFRLGWISADRVEIEARRTSSSAHSHFLRGLLESAPAITSITPGPLRKTQTVPLARSF